MKKKCIERVEGELGAKVEDDGYCISLLTTSNGYQWTGHPMCPELAKLTIEVLLEYLKVCNDKGKIHVNQESF